MAVNDIDDSVPMSRPLATKPSDNPLIDTDDANYRYMDPQSS